MTGEKGYPAPTGFAEKYRQGEKAREWEERRPKVARAGDLLGPAQNPQAIVIEDVNGDTAAFNGMYLIAPGALGSPDPAKWWAGQTIADRATGGIQRASTFAAVDAPHRHMQRGFAYSADGSVRIFGDWETVAPPPTPIPEPTVLTRQGSFTQPTNTTGTSQRVDFAVPFPAGKVPYVHTYVVGTSPITAAWNYSARGEDESGFTHMVWRASGSHAGSMFKYTAIWSAD